jgi:hypothetical protein
MGVILNMQVAMIKPLILGVSPQGENRCKQYQYCLRWA